MFCGANLASHVHALGPFCSCCCDGVLPMPKQGERSSWLRHPRHFCHHGLVQSMVFSGSLEMARSRPLTQQSFERGWCPSVSGRTRSTSQLLVEVRLKTSTATCLLCVTFRKRACWNSCLQFFAWWIVSAPTSAISRSLFGSWALFWKGHCYKWLENSLGPLLERALLQVA